MIMSIVLAGWYVGLSWAIPAVGHESRDHGGCSPLMPNVPLPDARQRPATTRPHPVLKLLLLLLMVPAGYREARGGRPPSGFGVATICPLPVARLGWLVPGSPGWCCPHEAALAASWRTGSSPCDLPWQPGVM